MLSPSLTLSPLCPSVNVGGYIQAVLDRNLAENISRVLYPNDNVCHPLGLGQEACVHTWEKAGEERDILWYPSHTQGMLLAPVCLLSPLS